MSNIIEKLISLEEFEEIIKSQYNDRSRAKSGSLSRRLTRTRCNHTPPSRGPCDVPLALKDYVQKKNILHVGASQGVMVPWWAAAGVKSYTGIEIATWSESNLKMHVRSVENNNFKYSIANLWSAFPNDPQVAGSFGYDIKFEYNHHKNSWNSPGYQEQNKNQWKIDTEEMSRIIHDEVDVMYMWSLRGGPASEQQRNKKWYTKEEISFGDNWGIVDKHFLKRKIREHIDRPITTIIFCGNDLEIAQKYGPDEIVSYKSKELAAPYVADKKCPSKVDDWRHSKQIYFAINFLNH